MTRAVAGGVLVAMAWALPHGASAAQIQSGPTEALVIFGADTVRAEVASTPEARERGLMFRETVPEGTGMLFVFNRPDAQGIWMKDTYVPLDAAFIDASYRVVSIESLEPLDETVEWSPEPVLFVLEVRQGWFAERGIVPGQRVRVEFGRWRGSCAGAFGDGSATRARVSEFGPSIGPRP
jgi:hypothetical protein